MQISMSASEQVVLRSALERCTRYAEYGAGGSTCLAASIPSITSLVSIESDPAFASDVRAVCPRGEVRWINLGPISSYGHPRDDAMKSAWPTYSDQDLSDPDLVLVDGRFRVACMANVLLRYPKATLLVHDFPFRTEYHAILQFVHVRSTTDTLVTLQKKEEADDMAILALYEAYQFEQA
jgi:hypothetical protein